jgi:endonuclease/exonuclease/phosphatase family metal-dependent hydrolase
MAPAGRGRLHPHGRAPAGLLQPAAVLRPGSAGRVGQVAAAPFRVATWNIRAAIGPGEPFPPAWWRHVTDERFARIVGIIRDLDADVVALQEVALHDVDGDVRDQPLELARLTDRHVRYGATHAFALVEPDTGRAIGTASWGNALLTRRPVSDGFTLGLPVGGDDDIVDPAGGDMPLAGVRFADAPPGTREPRCVVAGRLRLGPSEALVLSTHLAYAGAGQRARQSSAILAIAEGYPPPVVLLGDMNAAIEAPELASLAADFVDAFLAVGVAPGDPARASCGRVAIDHVLVRGLVVDDCRVVRDAGDASDHLPVVATLRPEVG